MPRTLNGDAWEQQFRKEVRRVLDGLTVSEHNGSIRLRYKAAAGNEALLKTQTAMIKIPWSEAKWTDALALIKKVAVLIIRRDHDSLKGAVAAAQDTSTTMRRSVDWRAVAQDLRRVRQEGRNQIIDATWRKAYELFFDVAIPLIDSGQVTDGYSLLRETLQHWEGKPSSRNDCCNALRLLTQRACAFHGAASAWEVRKAHIDELKGKAATARIKATLSDAELLSLIDHIENTQKRPDWANALKVLIVYGLRPVELGYLSAKPEHAERKALWVSYQKVCGGSKTPPRAVDPSWLKDADGEPVIWPLFDLIQAGLLELPKRRDGGKRQMDASDFWQYLKRFVPQWKTLTEQATARGEWLRTGYVWRDSYSLRCHQRGIEMGAIARSMGHSVAVHSQSYRWASDLTQAEAFAAVS